MKRAFTIFLLVLVIFNTGVLFAAPAPDFDKVVDFSITLKKLNKMASENNFSGIKGRYIVLDGALSSFSVIDKNPDNYTVELILVNGEWEGVTDVHIFRSVVRLKGKEYINMFPARRKKRGTGSEISLNSGLIILAKLNDVRNMGSAAVPVLDGYYLRVYK